MHSMSLLRMLKRSLVLYPSHPLWNALPSFKQLVFELGKGGGWERIRSSTTIPNYPGGGRSEMDQDPEGQSGGMA